MLAPLPRVSITGEMEKSLTNPLNGLTKGTLRTVFAGALLAVVLNMLPTPVLAADKAYNLEGIDPSVADEPTWAVGAAFRSATIPFASDDRKVATFIPFVFYEGDSRFYFRGLETGFTFWKPGKWKVSAMGRMRFFDIPSDYQNAIQGDTFLWGVQGRYSFFGPWHLDLEVLSDFVGGELANARVGGAWEYRNGWTRVYGQAQYKTSDYNSSFYGLGFEDISDGVELGVGASVLHTVSSNFFVFARGEVALLDKSVRSASLTNRDMTAQIFLGTGFKNDRTRKSPSVQESKRYVRLAHGWVTPSSLSNLFNGTAAPDPDNHQLTTIFYGHPLSDTFVGLPVQIYLHSGLGWHWANQKDAIQEVILSVKFYYTVPLPVRLRLGVAEGWSWASDIPYVEETKLTEKGYDPSQLLNFLDFSVDLNMGDAFGWIGARETLNRTWLGYDIHHRSAIFESAQQFGRIKGGGNVQMVYLQYDF